jgi:hypothetical protein
MYDNEGPCKRAHGAAMQLCWTASGACICWAPVQEYQHNSRVQFRSYKLALSSAVIVKLCWLQASVLRVAFTAVC